MSEPANLPLFLRNPGASYEFVTWLRRFLDDPSSYTRSIGKVPVGFASYSGSALGVTDGVTTHFVWAWDGTTGQEDMFDLTARPALGAEPVARKGGIYYVSYTAEFHHATVSNGVFQQSMDLNSSLGMSGFASASFPTERATGGAFPFGNISVQAPMAGGDYWDNGIENGSGVTADFFGFAYCVRFPLSV